MGAEGLVELDAGCLVDEIGLDGLVLPESIGDSRKSVFDLAGNDGDDRVGLDRYCMVGFARGEFGEEIDGILMGVELGVQRRSKGIERCRDSVEPCPVAPWRRRGERVFEDLQRMERDRRLRTKVRCCVDRVGQQRVLFRVRQAFVQRHLGFSANGVSTSASGLGSSGLQRAPRH
jgi:hypothetical protein